MKYRILFMGNTVEMAGGDINDFLNQIEDATKTSKDGIRTFYEHKAH